MRRMKGFTLIELLVVVAIISILMAILLPALKNARDQAMTIKCMANTRELAAAEFMYAQNSNGFITPINLETLANGGNTANRKWWTNLLIDQGFTPIAYTKEGGGVDWGKVNTGIFRCPKVTDTSSGYPCYTLPPSHTPAFVFAARGISVKASTLIRVTDLVMFFEMEDETTGRPVMDAVCPDVSEPTSTYGYRWLLPTRKGARRHYDGRSTVMSFFDGHAEVRAYADVSVNKDDLFGHRER